MNDELLEFLRAWMVSIVETTPLVPIDEINNTFTYEEVDYEFTLSLWVQGTNVTLISTKVPDNYPEEIVPFAVAGQSTDIPWLVNYINQNITNIVIFVPKPSPEEDQMVMEQSVEEPVVQKTTRKKSTKTTVEEVVNAEEVTPTPEEI